MMLLLLILTIILILYILINYCKTLWYWKDKGIKYVTPLPIVGNALPIVLQTKTLAEFVTDLYYRYPDERYCGTFQYGQPILLLRDLNLIKRIFIKEFDTFPDHPIPSSDPKDDPLWGKNLFAATGDRWKHLRQTIGPVFTISKMKSMFELMEDCTKQLMDYLKEQDDDVVEVELRDIFKRYSADVIATIAFGIKCNSHKERDNQFITMGTELTNFGGVQKLKRMLYTVNPLITKILNLKMHPENVVSFFRTMVNTTIKTREKQSIKRPDFIQHLLEARKGHLQDEEQDLPDTEFAIAKESKQGIRNKQFPLDLTDDDITAQALDFFYGGFYSTSTLMCFCLYELVVNPNIQEKLKQEVDETLKQNGGKINYDALTKMKYLDMVISETLRKWPTSWIDRKSCKPIIIEADKPTEKPLYLESGTVCWIPVFAIHRDSHYWPNPEKFDPERFSAQNRSKICISAFLPFGSGPRNCIGSRFAVLEAKLVIFHILSCYEVVPVEKSIMVKNLYLTPASSFWFAFRNRERN